MIDSICHNMMIIRIDGSTHEGSFKDIQQDGFGCYEAANGEKLSGLWEDGVFIKEAENPQD